MTDIIFGPGAPPTKIRMAHGKRSLGRFQRVPSVRNTPVERPWRDLNEVTRKYRVEFEELEEEGVLIGGDFADNVDLWVLHQVMSRPPLHPTPPFTPPAYLVAALATCPFSRHLPCGS